MLLDAFATYRLTRLIVEDRIFDTPRGQLVRVLQRRRAYRMLDLLGCSWFVSVWVAFGVVVLRRFVPRGWDPAARVLAMSAVAGAVTDALRFD